MRRLVLGAALLPAAWANSCPNECNKHGVCNTDMQCECFDGWTSADCSLRSCPVGPAWFGGHQTSDGERAEMECSNMGYCERDKGTCDCEKGYTGAACERTECPDDCHGRGRCLSMKELAEETQYGVYTYASVWDAERIFGCDCDLMYTGYNCALLACPTGDDPLTTGQVDEVQLVKCKASSGTLKLSWDDRYTHALDHDATAGEVVQAFKDGVQISVEVSYSSGLSLCTSDGSNIASVTFLQNFGDLSSLRAVSSLNSGSTLQVAEGGAVLGGLVSVDGDKEDALCSNHGVCDHATGQCTCLQDYQASDGRGGPGSRGDCGYSRHAPTACPAFEEVECAGHGTCSGSPNYECECYDGWDVAGDCSERSCPVGLSWFQYPSADETSHDEYAECSNRGHCDRVAGTCDCATAFTGSACEFTQCHGLHTSGVRCQQGGACVSQQQMAAYTKVNGEFAGYTYGDSYSPATWDAEKIFGCMCDDMPGVVGGSRYGYDCALNYCMDGDDPNTDGEDELQALECVATEGTFKIEFRTRETVALAFDASAAEVEAALEDLHSLDDVEVTYSAGASACTADGSNTISLRFVSEGGDVPALIPEAVTGDGVLTIATDGDTLNGVATNAGTTDAVQCANHGVCSEDTGVCECFFGYGYSDGDGGKGGREDCGFRQLIMGQIGGAAVKLDCNDRKNRDEPECIERLAKAFAARLQRG